MVFVGSVGYGAFRLSRYRPKYILEKKKADDMQQVLDDMNAEAILPGARDYAAVGAAFTTTNPLHEANQLNKEQLENFHNDINPVRGNAGSRGGSIRGAPGSRGGSIRGTAESRGGSRRGHSAHSTVDLDNDSELGPAGPSYQVYKNTKHLLS